MISLTDTLQDLIADNPLLQYGLMKRLFNLSQLSRELKPQVEVRAKKEVQESAILMALSRLQKKLPAAAPAQNYVGIENLTMQTGLSMYTFTKTKEVHQGVHKLFISLQSSNRYITICEGMHEITILLETEQEPRVRTHVGQKPSHRHDGLTAIGLTFNEAQYLATPGVICLVLQQLMLQSINLVEVSSTYSGLTLYVADEDAKLAFETLYRLLQ